MKITNELDFLRYKTYNSFNFFTRYFFKERNNKRFIISEHHQRIFDALDDVLSGKTKRLIINIAPRYGKTEIAVKNFIAYCLAVNPKGKFIHLSYSDQLALDNSEEIKDLIQSDEYQRLFPYVQIKKDSRAKNKWYTTEGGGVLARSASGQVTGFGAGTVDDIDEFTEYDVSQFGGAIIIDDPIKPDDADSETQRNKVNYKYDSTIKNRVNSRNTPIIVIMQRLHPDDLCGYLQANEPDEWRVECMPCIKEDGTALWEFKHTIDELLKLEKSNEKVFQTQYMQNPQPRGGLLFAKDSLNYYNGKLNKEDVIATYSFVDVADTGEDYHSAPIGKLLNDNKIYIDDVYFTKLGTDVNVNGTADIINNHNVNFVKVENNFGGSMYQQLLQPLINSSTTLQQVRAKGNKHGRIMALSGFIKEHFVFRNDYEHNSDYYLFMKNLTQYLKDGKSSHDDAPDSLEGLAKIFLLMHSDVFQVTQM